MLWGALSLFLLLTLMVEAQIFQQPVAQASPIMTSFHTNSVGADASQTQSPVYSTVVMTDNQRLDSETGSSVAAVESASGVFSPVNGVSDSSGGVSNAQSYDGSLQSDVNSIQSNVGRFQSNNGNSNSNLAPATPPQSEVLIKQWKSKTSMKEPVHVTLYQDQYGLRVNIDIG